MDSEWAILVRCSFVSVHGGFPKRLGMKEMPRSALKDGLFWTYRHTPPSNTEDGYDVTLHEHYERYPDK